MRRRRERENFLSSDTDSRSDLERAVSSAPAETQTSLSRPTSSVSASPSLQASRSASDSNLTVKSSSPAKGHHRSRLKGESSGEVTSSRHRSHRPPRARSRHSNSFKPHMMTHYEFADAHAQSVDTLDFSASDVGATEDCSTTDHYRSPSTSTNDLDSLSIQSQQQTPSLEVPHSAVSASPTSTKTIIPSPCSVMTLKDDPLAESDSDKTLCAASPSSTDAKFSSPLVSTSSSSGAYIQGSSSSTCSNGSPSQASSTSKSASSSFPYPAVDCVDTLSDCEDGECCTPPYPDAVSAQYVEDAAESSALTLCSSGATLQGSTEDMKEVTDSPPATSDGSSDIATSFSSVESALAVEPATSGLDDEQTSPEACSDPGDASTSDATEH